MTLSRRTLTTTVLALGFALGTPALAAADARFHSQDGRAGPEGASLTMVHSVVGADGSVSFTTVTYTAGALGAGASHVTGGVG
ncbi:hypothetical protein [Nocardiopsis sp. MG754419]|uniref:hypothetical protein n=1 Tax=Nocardiopsis sp. MG754419 TaxID=2259865 RepID=UPI001BAA5B85|nr:hypothetical protein [Nocardiopsis sp. MG754419]MBR8740856.1 hypothetical protein [Nocardiopsis sp. MG754419]